jgi:hypothetical protein
MGTQHISCPSTSFCVAVGTYVSLRTNSATPVIETYNGSKWVVTPSPDPSPGNDILNAVSCTSKSFCVATGNSFSTEFFIETYNGSKWSVVPAPASNGSGSPYYQFLGVSCTNPNFCVAAGTLFNSPIPGYGYGIASIATYNGSSWSFSAVSPPSGAGNFGSRLEGISCTSTSFCMAFGETERSFYVEMYNGSFWSGQNDPGGAPNLALSGISCASTSFCVAIGVYSPVPPGPGVMFHSIIEKYNGASWSLSNTYPTPTGTLYSLLSVSCTSTFFCVAVGGYSLSIPLNAPDVALVETYNGSSWSVDPSSNMNTTQSSSDYLTSVSCVSSNECAATGWYHPTPSCSPGSSTTTSGSSNYFGSLIEATGALQVSSVPSSGYWTVASDGGIFSYGNAAFYGSMGGKHLNAPMVAIAATPSGKGYWTVASDGGVFSYGDAKFHGSMGGKHLNEPMVGIASGPSGCGYWTVASDGGVFSYGDAKFHGSMGGKHLNSPVVGIAPTQAGNGYWLVASDGGIFAFGTAKFYGSMGGRHLNSPVIGMVPTADGKGYLLVAADGGVFAFGDANFYGSQGGKPLNAPMVSIASTPDDQGYWTVASDGGVFSYGDARFYGSMGGRHLNAPMVGIAST